MSSKCFTDYLVFGFLQIQQTVHQHQQYKTLITCATVDLKTLKECFNYQMSYFCFREHLFTLFKMTKIWLGWLKWHFWITWIYQRIYKYIVWGKSNSADPICFLASPKTLGSFPSSGGWISTPKCLSVSQMQVSSSTQLFPPPCPMFVYDMLHRLGFKFWLRHPWTWAHFYNCLKLQFSLSYNGKNNIHLI